MPLVLKKKWKLGSFRTDDGSLKWQVAIVKVTVSHSADLKLNLQPKYMPNGVEVTEIIIIIIFCASKNDIIG